VFLCYSPEGDDISSRLCEPATRAGLASRVSTCPRDHFCRPVNCLRSARPTSGRPLQRRTGGPSRHAPDPGATGSACRSDRRSDEKVCSLHQTSRSAGRPGELAKQRDFVGHDCLHPIREFQAKVAARARSQPCSKTPIRGARAVIRPSAEILTRPCACAGRRSQFAPRQRDSRILAVAVPIVRLRLAGNEVGCPQGQRHPSQLKTCRS
jgi:hypothetical protein